MSKRGRVDAVFGATVLFQALSNPKRILSVQYFDRSILINESDDFRRFPTSCSKARTYAHSAARLLVSAKFRLCVIRKQGLQLQELRFVEMPAQQRRR